MFKSNTDTIPLASITHTTRMVDIDLVLTILIETHVNITTNPKEKKKKQKIQQALFFHKT